MRLLKTNKGWAIGLVVGLVMVIASGSFLVIQDDLHVADAIVVIGGDHKPDRVRRAVELYQQGYAPIVIISAGTSVQEGTETLPEALVMRQQALALGLPEQAIVLEQESLSTLQNALYTKALCQTRGITSIVLVTSALHSRRARRIFHDVMGDEIAITVQSAPQDFCSLCWVFQPDQAYVVAYEFQNWFRYWTKWGFR